MISHATFMVLCALIECGGKAGIKRLTDAVDSSVDKSRMKEYLGALLKASLIEASKSSYKLIASNNFSEAYNNYFKPIKLEASKAYQSAVSDLLHKSVKMANPRYRSVVDGTRSRRNPLQQFAEKHLSRQDLENYWREIGEMSESEREIFSAKITSLVTRSRRD